MINEKNLESKNYCWLEEMSESGFRDMVTKGVQYNIVEKFFKSKRLEIDEAGYKYEGFVNSIILKTATIKVVKNGNRITEKLVYIEQDIESIDWISLIIKDLNDKTIFIIPENPL